MASAYISLNTYGSELLDEDGEGVFVLRLGASVAADARVFPVHVEAVEAVLAHEADGVVDEALHGGVGGDDVLERREFYIYEGNGTILGR
jgi:hypothetical protein